MKDQDKTKEQLIDELVRMRQRIAELETSEADRKQAEETLREAKEFSGSFIASMKDGFSVLDSHGVPIDVNLALCQMTGFSREELIGVGPPHPYWPPEAYEEIERAFQKTLQGEFGGFELTFMRKNGERFPAIVSPSWIKDKQGNVISYFATVKDITERKRAEEALEMQARVLESMAEGVNVSDENGVIFFTNPTFDAMFGYERGELIGKHVSVLNTYPPEENALIVAEIIEQLKTQGAWFGEVSNRKKDGTVFTTYARVSGLEISGKKLWISVQEDITERKRAEEALQESQQLLERTFASLLDAVFVIDGDTVEIMDCNPAASEIFGYSRDEMLGRTTTFLHVDEAALEEFREHLYPAVEEKGFLFLPEFRMKRKDGTVFSTEHSVIPLEDERGKRIGWVSVVQDITERKRAEEALQQSEERFRLAFENANIGMCLVDLDGRLTRVNSQMCEIFGYNQEELESMTVNDLAHPEDLHVSPQFIQRAVTGETEHTQFEKRYFHKQGHIVWGLVSSSLVRDSQGAPLYFISHVQDITERKRAEEELRKYRDHLEELVEERTAELERLNQGMLAMLEDLRMAKEQAEEADRLKTAFLATVSHELRTPLASIKGFASTLLADDVTWEPQFQRDFMETIDREADRLTELIGQLLDMSRLESGTLRIDRQLCHLTDVLTHADEQLAMLTANHVLVMAVAPGLPRLNVDPSRISNVLTNLVSNAAKFAPAGTKITVTAQAKDRQVVVSVADEGTGIAPEHQAHLFERFYRVDDELTCSRPGTGLGLAICKGLVEAHGGSIWVESEPGRGATFYFNSNC